MLECAFHWHVFAASVLLSAAAMRPEDKGRDLEIDLSTSPKGPRQATAHVEHPTVLAAANASAPNPMHLGDDVSGHIAIRPHDGKEAEKVQFGIALRKFHYLHMQEGTFMADVVMTFIWSDERATELIPKGTDSVTLSHKESESKLWMPSMAIVNRDISGIDELSTVVTISKDGKITKVKRVIGRFQCMASIADYPFDKQKMEIVISSTDYMSDEVVMEPIPGHSSVASSRHAFDGKPFHLLSVDVSAFKDKIATMKKSRGKMTIVIERSAKGWYGTCSTCAFLMIMSYSVFLFPKANTMIMPRVATAMIAFLSMCTAKGNYIGGIAGIPGQSWGEYYFQSFMFLQLVVLVGNVFLELIDTELKQSQLANTINSEMRVIFPFVAVFSYYLTGVPAYRYAGILTTACIMTCYCIGCALRVHTAVEHKAPENDELASSSGPSRK